MMFTDAPHFLPGDYQNPSSIPGVVGESLGSPGEVAQSAGSFNDSNSAAQVALPRSDPTSAMLPGARDQDSSSGGDEFVEVLASSSYDIAWRSCAVFLRSTVKANGKFRAKCTFCGQILPGRVYRLIRHVDSECTQVTNSVREQYMADLVDTGKDYGQRGGRIVNSVKKRIHGGPERVYNQADNKKNHGAAQHGPPAHVSSSGSGGHSGYMHSDEDDADREGGRDRLLRMEPSHEGLEYFLPLSLRHGPAENINSSHNTGSSLPLERVNHYANQPYHNIGHNAEGENGNFQHNNKKRPRTNQTAQPVGSLAVASNQKTPNSVAMAYCAPCVNLRDDFHVFDLSYTIDAQDTVFWPGSTGFKLCMDCCAYYDQKNQTAREYYAGSFTCDEHAGTHVDAPFHFHKDGLTVEQLPLTMLMGPCKVIDLRHKLHHLQQLYQQQFGDASLSSHDMAVLNNNHQQHHNHHSNSNHSHLDPALMYASSSGLYGAQQQQTSASFSTLGALLPAVQLTDENLSALLLDHNNQQQQQQLHLEHAQQPNLHTEGSNGRNSNMSISGVMATYSVVPSDSLNDEAYATLLRDQTPTNTMPHHMQQLEQQPQLESHLERPLEQQQQQQQQQRHQPEPETQQLQLRLESDSQSDYRTNNHDNNVNRLFSSMHREFGFVPANTSHVDAHRNTINTVSNHSNNGFEEGTTSNSNSGNNINETKTSSVHNGIASDTAATATGDASTVVAAMEEEWSRRIAAARFLGQFTLTAEDIVNFERVHGRLQPQDLVVVRTGWAQYWTQGSGAYLGYDERVQGPYQANLHPLSFPGIGEDAAHLLVERQIAGVGIDTASLDAGFADDFIAHRVLLSAGIFGIENLSAEINHVPSIGASLQVLPLKLKGGSGAPARVVAFTRKMKM